MFMSVYHMEGASSVCVCVLILFIRHTIHRFQHKLKIPQVTRFDWKLCDFLFGFTSYSPWLSIYLNLYVELNLQINQWNAPEMSPNFIGCARIWPNSFRCSVSLSLFLVANSHSAERNGECYQSLSICSWPCVSLLLLLLLVVFFFSISFSLVLFCHK